MLNEIELRVAELAAHAAGVEAIAATLNLLPNEAAATLETIYRKLGPPTRSVGVSKTAPPREPTTQTPRVERSRTPSATFGHPDERRTVSEHRVRGV
ncbi:MAG: hypothetical protein ABIQ18_49210 [Umezawaea sp.]